MSSDKVFSLKLDSIILLVGESAHVYECCGSCKRAKFRNEKGDKCIICGDVVGQGYMYEVPFLCLRLSTEDSGKLIGQIRTLCFSLVFVRGWESPWNNQTTTHVL